MLIYKYYLLVHKDMWFGLLQIHMVWCILEILVMLEISVTYESKKWFIIQRNKLHPKPMMDLNKGYPWKHQETTYVSNRKIFRKRIMRGINFLPVIILWLQQCQTWNLVRIILKSNRIGRTPILWEAEKLDISNQ